MQEQSLRICPHTVKELLLLWLDTQKEQVKPSSYSTYRCIVHRRLLPWWGDVVIAQVDQSLVAAFAEEKRRQGMSEKTLYDAVNILNAAFRYGAQQYQFVNQGLGYRCRKGACRDVRTLSLAEQRQLERYLHSQITAKNVGILLALYTGLRIGEVCALRWGDIDLQARCIKIERTVQRIQTAPGKTALYFGTPKSAASVRQIPIAACLLPTLQSVAAGRSPEDYLLSGNAVCVEPRAYQYYCKKVFAAADLPGDIHFHTLRHTFATRCVESNLNVKAISKIMGHSSVQITLNLYAHPSFQFLLEQIQRLDFPA